jgi:hypothetical protein
MSALQLCLWQGRIGGSTRHSAPFRLNYTRPRGLWNYDLLLWNRWEIWMQKVESPEEYIVSYRSQRNEWLSTCIFYSWYILVGADSNGSAICIKSVRWWLLVCLQGYIVVNNSWYLVFDRYKKQILQRKGRLVMFVSTYSQDLKWNIR